MKYDTKFFISKFEKIPDEKWITDAYRSGQRACAVGHCEGKKGVTNEQSRALRKLFTENFPIGVMATNDAGESVFLAPGVHARELGDSPKERVINALLMIDSKLICKK